MRNTYMLTRLVGRMVKLRRNVNRNIILLALTSLCADISTEMMYPVLPLFLTSVLGASPPPWAEGSSLGSRRSGSRPSAQLAYLAQSSGPAS